MKHPVPKSHTMETASSKPEYLTAKNSGGMPSFTAEPRGEDKSRIMRTDPSFFGTAPRGEQWNEENGGAEKGPAVWPLWSSLKIALETSHS